MKHRTKRTSGVIALLLCLTMLLSLLPASAAAEEEDVWDGWTFASAWTKNNDDSISYAGTDLGAGYTVYCDTPVNTNCVSILLRQDGASLTDNSHMGLSVKTTSGDTYYFMYCPWGGYASVKRFPASGGEEFLNTVGNYPSVPQNEFTEFKIIYDETCVNFYINDSLCHTVAGDFASLFAGATAGMQTYATPISVKQGSFEPFVDPWGGWSYSPAWTLNDDDSMSYTGTDLGAGYTVLHPISSDVNCVTMELRQDGTALAGNGHMGVYFLTPSGDGYYFMYSTTDGYACVKRLPASGGEVFLNTSGNYPSVPQNTFAEFKVIFDDAAANFYINDTLCHSIPGDWTATFLGASAGILTYATPVTVKKGSFETAEIEQWSGWDKNETDDCYSYVGTDIGAAHALVYKKAITTNCVEFALRKDGDPMQNNAHLGVRLTQQNGDAYYFMTSPYFGYAAIIRYPAGGGEEYVNTTSAYATLTQGEWTSFKIVATDTYLGYYVGGQLMFLLYGDYSGLLTDCVPSVVSYATPASAKCLNLDPTEIGDLGGTSFPDDWGHNANWTWNEEDGCLTYNNAEMISVISCSKPVTTTAVTYSVRVDGTVTDSDSNFGLHVKTKDGYDYFFQYNSFIGYGGQGTWVTENLPDGDYRWISSQAAAALSDGEWHTVTNMFRDDLVAIFVDGALTSYHLGDYTGKFEDALLTFQSYKTPVSFRLESVGTTVRGILDYDFEFRSEAAVGDFTAENGTLSYDGDSSLIFTVGGADASFTSPTIPDCVGYKYSARSTVHNTILMRVKNDSAAEAMRVYITTDGGTVYRDVPMEPHSDWDSYFVNFSPYPVEGYIRQVRFAPLGVSEGRILMDAFTFEREMPDDETAGRILSCTADFEAQTVTVTGELNAAYAGHTVTVYETDITNVMSTLKGDVIGSVTPDGTSFTYTFPLYDGNISRLPSYFICGVDGVRVSDRFLIDNGADAEENPYAFELPELTVSVLDFGAKGDAFTDDTAAIQAAVDYVAAQGGGHVIVPGDTENRYGKRYMVTNIKLKSYVDLHLEEGAILWQTARAWEYDYIPAYGHNAFLEVSIPWCAAAFVTNWPLVSGYELEYAKLTGQGTIRGADHGGESWDGCTGENRDLNCDSLIHCMTSGWYHCKNMEISGVHLERSGGYHCIMMYCENMYCADLKMCMPICTEADIITPFSSKNVFINYVHGFSNDDSVVLSASKEDPRGYASAWWDCRPDDDNSCRNVTVCHSAFCGGKGLTFIGWGTSKEDLSEAKIEHIRAYDCRFNTLATWYDNPYHGTPYFTSLEHDYSTVSDVRIENCWFDKTPSFSPVPATNVVTDVEGLHSAVQFEYGGFDRNDPDYPDWVVGLAGWTYEENGGSVEEFWDGNDRIGRLTGDAMLCQGLYMSQYHKVFSAEVNVVQGGARMFVRDILTGEELASRELAAGDSGVFELPFVGTDRNVFIGVEGTSADSIITLDDLCITHDPEEVTEDTCYPIKESYIIDQKKPLIEVKNSDAGAVFYRTEVEGQPRVLLSRAMNEQWQMQFTVQPKCEDNLLRTKISNSDEGKEILMDFRYYNDNQLYISYQFKLTRTTWSPNTEVWVELPEGSREYHVSMTHVQGADVLILEVTDADGSAVYREELAHPNYTNSSYYSSQYGLNFRILDWTPLCELRGLYVGDIGGNEHPAETYTVRWNVNGEFTKEIYQLGETPVFKGAAVRASDETYRYEFIGWDKPLDPVRENITFAAQWRKVPLSEPQAVKISSAYLRIDENINVIFAAELSEECTNPYMVFNWQGKDITVRDYTVDESGRLLFELKKVVPQCMGDAIAATVYAKSGGETVSDTVANYSIRTYCENQLAKTDDTKLITLLSDLLTYGAAAQTYTGYKTDALVTSGLDLTPSTFTALEGKKVIFTGEKSEIADWYSATLGLANELSMRFTFTAASVDGLSVDVTIGGRTQTFTKFEPVGDGRYAVMFRGIKATEFDDDVTATFKQNGTPVGRAVSYSVNTYISGMQACGITDLEALVQALYNYGVSAAAYAAE